MKRLLALLLLPVAFFSLLFMTLSPIRKLSVGGTIAFGVIGLVTGIGSMLLATYFKTDKGANFYSILLVISVILLAAIGLAEGLIEHSIMGWSVFGAFVLMVAIPTMIAGKSQPVPTSTSQKGIRYEEYCAKYLLKHGFRRIKTTPISGDYGADLVAIDKNGRTWVFQCKKYTGKVSVDAVQEIVAAKAHYNASCGAVLTNSQLTENAKRLAWENAIEIIEGLSD